MFDALRRFLARRRRAFGRETLACPWHVESGPTVDVDYVEDAYWCRGCGRVGRASDVAAFRRRP